MLTTTELDQFARNYYLATDIADHRLEHQIQLDSIPRILSHVDPGSRILELGYGDGLLTEALQQRFHGAQLLEGSDLLCERARAKHEGIIVHNALFETFAPEQPYDTVLALHVLEHLDDPALILRRIGRWLAPGGTVVIVVPNRQSLHRRLALRMGLIAELDELSARDHLVGHQRVYDFYDLERDVASAGMRVRCRFGSFLKTLPNSMMLGFGEDLLTALDAVSDELPPELLANIGLVAEQAPG
jgi:SAM-dependent methyltransferase